jgi:ABC-type transport system substrate-binding protein
MNGTRTAALHRVIVATAMCILLGGGLFRPAAAQPRPEGEMRWALYVTLSPQWFDPGEVVGLMTPFWVLYAIHDAVVKPMPGNLMTPSLAESWTVSADQRVYDFKLREGIKFHNGDSFTAEDVKFSFHANALYGNAATRMSEIVPTDGTYAYGGYPDVDALYRHQARETDRRKREMVLHQIQQILHERVRFAPIWEYIWPSGLGPRVEEPALMLINPYPWSAPLEEVRLRKK